MGTTTISRLARTAPRTPVVPRQRATELRRGAPARDGDAQQPAGEGFGPQLAALIRGRVLPFTPLRFDAGATIYRGALPDPSVYLITAGRVKTVMYSRAGKKCLLRIHSPGEVLGELALLEGARTESAVTMCATSVQRVSTAALLQVMAAPEVHRHLIKHLGERLAEQQKAISHLVTDDSEHRLGVTLLELAERLGQPDRDSVRIAQRITHEELAGMVGTTRSRIGLFLRRFQECGAVEFSRGQIIRVRSRQLGAYLDARSDAC